jgi:hypothetical protein
MSLVLEVDESPHRVGGILAARIDQLEKRFGVVVVLTTRAATKRLAAGGIGRRDSRQDEERGRRARPVGIGLVLDQLGDLYELVCPLELGLRLADTACCSRLLPRGLTGASGRASTAHRR